MVYFNKKYQIGVLNISKNGSTSLTPWLDANGFKPLHKLTGTLNTDTLVFHIMRNPIKRFASGIVEALFVKPNDRFETYVVNNSILALSEPALEEFCLQLICHLDFKRDPGAILNPPDHTDHIFKYWKHEPHMRLQTDFIKGPVDIGCPVIPVSFEFVPNFGFVVYRSIDHKNKTSLISEPIPHLNKSDTGKRMMAEKIENILMRNWEMSIFDQFRQFLMPDIIYWNKSLNTEFMNKYNRDEHISVI